MISIREFQKALKPAIHVCWVDYLSGYDEVLVRVKIGKKINRNSFYTHWEVTIASTEMTHKTAAQISSAATAEALESLNIFNRVSCGHFFSQKAERLSTCSNGAERSVERMIYNCRLRSGYECQICHEIEDALFMHSRVVCLHCAQNQIKVRKVKKSSQRQFEQSLAIKFHLTKP